MTKAANTLVLMAGGDVGPTKQPVDRLAELVLPVLRQADFRLVQCERTYSERGVEQQWTAHSGVKWFGPASSGITSSQTSEGTRLHPELSSIFKTAGIDVVSLASNHTTDWGYEPLLDTIELFRTMGMQVIGAGVNAEEARRPAIVEKNGVKVAILGYCSVLREGMAAGPNKPGIAPVRAFTYYQPLYYYPGSPPHITSAPLEEDLAAMKEDIAKAKARADAVVIFIHWGLAQLQKTIATYEPTVAHAAIDAGADIIIGHHSHVPKAVEVYKGKVCFYCIGNLFTFGRPGRHMTPYRKTPQYEQSAVWGLVWNEWPAYSEDTLYAFPIHFEKTILPKVHFSNKGVERVAFLPAYINKLAQPEVLTVEDPRFSQVVQYLEWVSDQVPHTFRVEGNEVVVETQA